MKKVKLGIVEDCVLHIECIKETLKSREDFTVVSIENSAKCAIHSYAQTHPEILLIDYQLPDITGLEVSKRIASYKEETKIIMLTSHVEESIIKKIILCHHVDGILIKGSNYFEGNLLLAIDAVRDGGMFMDPSILEILRSKVKVKKINDLTNREFEVLIQIMAGKSDKMIADSLYVSIHHIRNIKSMIWKKLQGANLDEFKNNVVNNIQ